MWLFDRLNVRLKLALLAGVPVLGALLLSALIARDAQERAATVKAIGSVEDLVQLTERVARVVHELQAERSESSFRAGIGETTSQELALQEARTDRVLASLESFLNERDASKLPPALGENLRAARRQLRELPALRKRVRSEDFRLYEYLEFHSEATQSLIAATSVLSQLTGDGELMLSISRLVAAMQVIERTSREHALLSYVFGKKEFPPGTFRFFVSLLTEQNVYASSLRASANAEDYRRFQAVFEGPLAEKVKAMRTVALEARDETLEVDPREWFALQNGSMRELRGLEDGMFQSVRAAVAKKMLETRRSIRLGVGLAASVLLISTLLAWAIARSMTESVRVLYQAADTVQRNQDFSVRARKTSRDELGSLTDAFNAMLSGIQERDRELVSHRENLQALVEARTRELSRRNDQMRLVLDNVEEGLAMVDRDGNLLEECSRSFGEVFGERQAGMPFHTALAPDDPGVATGLRLGYAQYIDDFLPADVALAQLPQTLTAGDRQYALALKPVHSEGRPDGALLVVRDVTAEVAAQRAEAIQREQIKSFQRMLQDHYGFSEFFDEARGLVERIRERNGTDEAGWMRAIHTLKGNAALFEVRSVSDAAHDLESALLEAEREQADKALARLVLAWDQYAVRIAPLLGERLDQQLEVPKAELEHAVAAVRQRLPHSTLERMLVRWQLEPVRRRFGRVEEQLRALSRRLGKPEPEVVIECDDVRLPGGQFREFWASFAHVVRNTVDHGIVSPEERARKGKPPRTRVALTASSDADALVIEVRDDGPGIDWSRLAERATAAGLPAGTRADLVRALLTDGVSTSSHATETSGRGVGMSAVLAACTRARGKIVVDSEPGEGTLFRFVFPALEGNALPNAPRSSLRSAG
ncbi:MAG TPA: nitrate- and nitrite sensing domain-containing protein [Polyangiaceae bacterium]